jgi:hypothetical protein
MRVSHRIRTMNGQLSAGYSTEGSLSILTTQESLTLQRD